jgi:dihydroneopterin aldolase
MHTYLHEIDLTLEEAFSRSDDSSKNDMIDYSESAKSLIDGMEDHWCVALLEAIQKECADRIFEHWSKYNPEKNKKL